MSKTCCARAALDDGAIDLRAIARKPVFVLEHQHVADLLPRFQREGTHMALVSDEHGQISGLLTLEDVLEELVGEIADEYDVTEAPGVVRRADGTWLVDGSEAYENVREQVGLPSVPPDERGQYLTLAGFVLTRLGHIPMVGESLRVGDATLEVMDMDGRRIDKVLIRPDAMAPRQPGEPTERAR